MVLWCIKNIRIYITKTCILPKLKIDIEKVTQCTRAELPSYRGDKRMNPTEAKTSVKVIGANGQISLGKEFAGRQVLVEEREPGVWMVRTALVIPENELWLHQPKVKATLQNALEYAVSNPPAETTDLNAIARKIEDAKKKRQNPSGHQ